MKMTARLCLGLLTLPFAMRVAAGSPDPAERFGTVNFSTSCSKTGQGSFNRGVALLHDFWYEEAQRQFEQIAAAEPSCAMAHWGIAMSLFHQIWNQPDDHVMTHGWEELENARRAEAKTDRERDYIAALSAFYKPGEQDYSTRADAYSGAMLKVFRNYPDDVDAGAFYALSLLAAKKDGDTSLAPEQEALKVLGPLFVKYPNHPGLAHYIVHACDNPALASQGLNAARRYGVIAPSAAHSAHMPGHIFARLGMWPEDIEANVASVAAGEKALADHPGAILDQLHAYDFLLYAYLQSGQDAKAKSVVDTTAALVTRLKETGPVHGMDMSEMTPRFQTEFPTIYSLEMRDWKVAATLTPPQGAPPEIQTFTYWARIVANGHLRDPEAARADLAKFQALLEEAKRGKHAHFDESTWARVMRSEALSWAAFAEGDKESALSAMRGAADLQDKVGQREVDIPAREMLADMLLELNEPREASAEYELALKGSPNRFNGLFNAGRAAELAGAKTEAARYYEALLKNTSGGAQSGRAELMHVKKFLAGAQLAQSSGQE